MLSSQPGAVLCRVDNACDMIVSLRSLTSRVETVIVSVDADPRFWTINEKHKCKALDFVAFETVSS